jgi:thyrotropin-releasing hormone receptor
VCAVLRQPHMRSATNTLLVAMAIANTLTGVCPLPFFLNFYAELGGVKAYAEYIPERWCLAYIILADHLPTAFHTASVWLTLTLASQRYLYVCHAQRAQRYCTVRNALRATAVVFTLAGLSQLCRFFDRYIVIIN